MQREKPSEMEKEQWKILKDLMDNHLSNSGINPETYLYMTFSPQNKKDALYSRRLCMSGYLNHINPIRKDNQTNWNPIYTLSEKTFREFELKR